MYILIVFHTTQPIQNNIKRYIIIINNLNDYEFIHSSHVIHSCHLNKTSYYGNGTCALQYGFVLLSGTHTQSARRPRSVGHRALDGEGRI